MSSDLNDGWNERQTKMPGTLDGRRWTRGGRRWGHTQQCAPGRAAGSGVCGAGTMCLLLGFANMLSVISPGVSLWRAANPDKQRGLQCCAEQARTSSAGLCKSLPNSVQWCYIGSLKQATVGVVTPQQMANGMNQGFSRPTCFPKVGCQTFTSTPLVLFHKRCWFGFFF